MKFLFRTPVLDWELTGAIWANGNSFFGFSKSRELPAPVLTPRWRVEELESDLKALDRELERELINRDYWEKKATELAMAVGKHLNADVGEHSSANCPVDNAMIAIEEAK